MRDPEDETPTTDVPLSAPANGAAHAVTLPIAAPDSTLAFRAVLALPGQETTGPVPLGAPGEETSPPGPAGSAAPVPSGPTLNFGGVLPLPRATEAQARLELAPGQRLGELTLVRALERTSLGLVYAARHPVHGVCRVELRDPRYLERAPAYLIDARQRTTFEHPNLLRVVALGAEPAPWLATLAPPEVGLRDALAQGALTPAQAGRIALRLASALRYAHARRLVHGDLVPDDVGLVEGEHPLLSGFSRFVTVDDGGERVPCAGAPPLGAAPYAAPEVLRGQRPDELADIYALGALLYEALRGEPAFSGATAAEVLKAAMTSWPPKPDHEDTSLEARLLRVAWRCLAKRADDRYPSAVALEDALRTALGDDAPVDPAPSPPGSQARVFVALGLAVAALATLVALAVLLARG